MQIHFKLTLAQYLAAMRLHAMRSGLARLNYFGIRYIFPVVGILFLLGALTTNWRTAAMPAMLLGWSGVVLICLPIYHRYQLRTCYRRTRVGNGETTVSFGESVILCETESARSELQWRAVQSLRESREVMLIYLAPAKFIVVPKIACSAGQVEAIHSLFSQNTSQISTKPA